MGFYLPKTLEKKRNWILWKNEDGRKKPYSAIYDGLASVAKPYQWSSFGRAAHKLENTGDEYSGLGFVFTESCGLVFIDLDNCVDENGDPNEFASGIIELFKGSYIEYSQSGSGLHIVCRGAVPAAYKGSEIEIYNQNRYMAFTGNAYEANEPQPAQRALDELCKRFNITEKQQAELYSRKITADDWEIIQRIQRGKNGAEFKRLYSKGKYHYKKEDGTPDASKADMRLIALIWYYSGNAEQTERIYLNSSLAGRDKAQRRDYIQRTIARAAQGTQTAKQRGADQRGSGSHRKRTYWE